jgi:molybdate transport system substrate-binding protein
VIPFFVSWLVALTLAQGPPAPSRPLLVSAAVSLTEALQACGKAYEEAGGPRITFNFAGSNTLARQIINGAPVDVFVSADDAQMDAVERAGLILTGSRVPVLSNQLALIVSEKDGGGITTLASLATASVRRIAIGDPAAVPAGVYARQYLHYVGLWETLQPKLVPMPNVRAAMTAVDNGSADAAIVYTTDARVANGVRVAVTISGPGAPRIVYPAAVMSKSRSAVQGATFIAFLRGPIARVILEQHGFTVVP